MFCHHPILRHFGVGIFLVESIFHFFMFPWFCRALQMANFNGAIGGCKLPH